MEWDASKQASNSMGCSDDEIDAKTSEAASASTSPPGNSSSVDSSSETPASNRDFWIPSQDIRRDIIISEIPRYLGQNTLVRPCKNHDGDNGYLITAPSAPMTEMILAMKRASEYLCEKFSQSLQATPSRLENCNTRARTKTLGFGTSTCKIDRIRLRDIQRLRTWDER